MLAVADADGEIWSLQTIDADGGKLFMPGGRKRGCMFAIGEPGDRIVIAEGFATGASIHEATGLCVAVAFDAGNLEPVAKAIRAKRPACADRHRGGRRSRDADRQPRPDRRAQGGRGGRRPRRRPAFAQQPDGKKLDFNDLAIAEGSEAVAAIILAAFPELEPEPEQTSRNRARRRARGRLGSGWPRPVAELNERYFVAAMGGSVRIASTVHDDSLGPRAAGVPARGRHAAAVLAPPLKVGENAARATTSSRGSARRGSTTASAGPIDRIALIPSGPCPADVYNLWRGFGVEPKAGSWPTIEAHLRVGHLLRPRGPLSTG